MLSEEATDEGVPVSQSVGLDSVREQQQPRILDAATREHEVLRRDRSAQSRQTANLDVLDGRGSRIRLNVGNVRIGQDLDVGAQFEFTPVRLPKPCWRTVAPVVYLH